MTSLPVFFLKLQVCFWLFTTVSVSINWWGTERATVGPPSEYFQIVGLTVTIRSEKCRILLSTHNQQRYRENRQVIIANIHAATFVQPLNFSQYPSIVYVCVIVYITDSAFKQQRLPAWQPILTAGTVLPTFFIIGVAFIPIGIGLLYFSNNVRCCYAQFFSHTWL